jgi:hypothetical protein
MSLGSQKSGTKFGSIQGGGAGKHGILQPKEVAALIVGIARLKNISINAKQVAEGLGVVESESNFDASSKPAGNSHIGLWAESPDFGSESERLNPVNATTAAIQKWNDDGKSWWPAWGQWEKGEAEGAGPERYKKYLKLAEEALSSHIGIQESVVEQGENAISGATDFLSEIFGFVLDFKKLGQLGAEATAWLLRLILKAIWDYVIAPLIHWAERAESFYWRNFFSVGTEQGSGLGYQLRQNAGLITIGFWAIGYAVLWSDGESLSPAESHNSMLGQTVKKIEGAVARRNLVKPENVEKETPNKPKPNVSTTRIERTRELAVNRKRPVTVTGKGTETQLGRKSSERKRDSHRVPRPAQTAEGAQRAHKKIILPPGVKAEKDDSKEAASVS